MRLGGGVDRISDLDQFGRLFVAQALGAHLIETRRTH